MRASCQIVTWPVISSAAAIPWLMAPSEFDTTITLVRGKRSAITPPNRTRNTWGMVRLATTRPRSVTEPVMSRTAKAKAIGAMAFPRKDAPRLTSSSRYAAKAKGVLLGAAELEGWLPVTAISQAWQADGRAYRWSWSARSLRD